jgi:hypothetical protein
VAQYSKYTRALTFEIFFSDTPGVSRQLLPLPAPV